MLHETHHNTWDVSKRKPRQARNTPSNRIGHWGATAAIVGFITVMQLYITYGITENKKQRLIALATPTVAEQEAQFMFTDPIYHSSIKVLHSRREYAEKGVNITTDPLLPKVAKEILE